MSKRPTLRDIAKKADVSVSTVSQVVNNKPGVSAELRKRVLQVAAELGYRSTVVVEAELATEIRTIGLLTKYREDDALVVNPFYSHIIVGAERECTRHNISLMYANVHVDENNHVQNLPPMLLDERVDGVIVVGAFLEETLANINRRANQNTVLVDAYTTEGNAFDSVLIDNVSGAASAIQYLVSLGHRRIGLVGSQPASYPSIQERRHGYRKVLHQHGLDAFIEDSALNRTDACKATKRLIRREPNLTAIFACNDEVAIGVIGALQEEGLHVPDDISVIGFDDIDFAQEVTPPLTTLHVDKMMMGVVAVRNLIDRSRDPLRIPLKTLVVPQLIERASVRSCNG